MCIQLTMISEPSATDRQEGRQEGRVYHCMNLRTRLGRLTVDLHYITPFMFLLDSDDLCMSFYYCFNILILQTGMG